MSIAGRNVPLDLLRAIACYLVIQAHVGENYYIGADGGVLSGGGAVWGCWLNSVARCAVPLFVVLSGYFLLPVGRPTGEFLQRRFSRVGIPFVVWCILDALFFAATGRCEWGDVGAKIAGTLVNFGVEVGHLWYIYMLLGLYLLAPILSPWVASASEREMRYALILWLIASCLPYIHLFVPEIWGECYWNPTPMLYYFTGFVGYFVLGAYMKIHRPKVSPSGMMLAGSAFAAGYAVTAILFRMRLGTAATVADLELSWGQCTVNAVAMTVGMFVLVRAIPMRISSSASRAAVELSSKSFGIYLVHLMILPFCFDVIDPLIGNYPLKIVLIAAATFAVSYAAVKILSRLPYSKYLIG